MNNLSRSVRYFSTDDFAKKKKKSVHFIIALLLYRIIELSGLIDCVIRNKDA